MSPACARIIPRNTTFPSKILTCFAYQFRDAQKRMSCPMRCGKPFWCMRMVCARLSRKRRHKDENGRLSMFSLTYAPMWGKDEVVWWSFRFLNDGRKLRRGVCSESGLLRNWMSTIKNLTLIPFFWKRGNYAYDTLLITETHTRCEQRLNTLATVDVASGL